MSLLPYQDQDLLNMTARLMTSYARRGLRPHQIAASTGEDESTVLDLILHHHRPFMKAKQRNIANAGYYSKPLRRALLNGPVLSRLPPLPKHDHLYRVDPELAAEVYRLSHIYSLSSIQRYFNLHPTTIRRIISLANRVTNDQSQ